MTPPDEPDLYDICEGYEVSLNYQHGLVLMSGGDGVDPHIGFVIAEQPNDVLCAIASRCEAEVQARHDAEREFAEAPRISPINNLMSWEDRS